MSQYKQYDKAHGVKSIHCETPLSAMPVEMTIEVTVWLTRKNRRDKSASVELNNPEYSKAQTKTLVVLNRMWTQVGRK